MHMPMPSSVMILDTVVKSTLLLALAWSATMLLKKRSAATQHMVRTFALSALLLLPFAIMLVPAWHVKGIPEFSKSSHTAQRQTPVHSSTAANSAPTIFEAPAITTTRLAAPAAVLTPHFKSETRDTAHRKDQDQISTTSVVTFPAAPTSAGITPPTLSVSSEPTVSTPSLAARISVYLPRILLVLWIAGAIFFLARWRLNIMRMTALVRRAGVLTDSGWNAQVRALSGNLGIRRHVALLVSDEIEIPITTGIIL